MIRGTCDSLLEPLTRPPQRDRATGAPGFAIYQDGRTRCRRGLARAQDHRGAGAILRKGFNIQDH